MVIFFLRQDVPITLSVLSVRSKIPSFILLVNTLRVSWVFPLCICCTPISLIIPYFIWFFNWFQSIFNCFSLFKELIYIAFFPDVKRFYVTLGLKMVSVTSKHALHASSSKLSLWFVDHKPMHLSSASFIMAFMALITLMWRVIFTPFSFCSV